MKVAFLLQRRFAYIAHNLALWLKEKYGVTDFCGYVYLRSSYDFLKKQSDIQYTSLLLDEDVHKEYHQESVNLGYLCQLEQEYGLPTLWPYITLDRIIMYNQLVREYPYNTPRYTHEEMLRIFQVKARALINFIEREKPEVFIFPNIGGIGALLLYEIAKKKGIKTLVVSPAMVQNLYLFSETYDVFTDVNTIFARNMAGGANRHHQQQAEAFLKDFRNKPQTYHPLITRARQQTSRRRQLQFLAPRALLRSLRWFVHVIYYFITEYKYHDYSFAMQPWFYLIDRIKRKTRNLIGNADLYDPYTPEEDFAFFPLHIEPEVSTLLQAPFFTDQINLIRQIARSLPVHFKLYVKEHPLMVPYRPRRYYREIKKIPNVKLINAATSSFDIISHAKLITTITSTVGWEGIILKKPVITFGDCFYNVLSPITRCRKIEQLPYLIKEKLTAGAPDNDTELINFIAAIFEDSIPLDLQHMWEEETDESNKKRGLEPLADLIAKKLNLSAVFKP